MTTIILDPRQLRACPGPDPSHGRSTPDRRRDFSTPSPRQVLPSPGPNRACSSPGLRSASSHHKEDQADQVYTIQGLFLYFYEKKIFSWNIFRKDWTLRTYCITLRRQFMKPSVFRVHKKRDQPLSPAVFCEYLYMRKCSTRYLTPFLPPVKKTTLFSFRDFFVGTTDTIWMQ